MVTLKDLPLDELNLGDFKTLLKYKRTYLINNIGLVVGNVLILLGIWYVAYYYFYQRDSILFYSSVLIGVIFLLNLVLCLKEVFLSILFPKIVAVGCVTMVNSKPSDINGHYCAVKFSNGVIYRRVCIPKYSDFIGIKRGCRLMVVSFDGYMGYGIKV